MAVYILAEAAAVLFALGSVVQQRAAATAPPEKALSFALLWFLVRQPRWLAGTVASLVGNGLSAAALSTGGVALVQPLLTSRLVIVLLLTAVIGRMRIPMRDWAAAVVAAGGLGVFVAVGQPRRGAMAAVLGTGALQWAPVLAGSTVLVVVLIAVARRQPVTRAALSLGTAAGILFGVQSSLTEAATGYLRRSGPLALVDRWEPALVAVAAVCGAVLIQSAYEMAPLQASFPALVTVEPIVGLVVGVAVLHGVLDTSTAASAGEAGGLIVMVAGVAALARSPLVTGQAAALQRRRDEGLAHRAADQLEHLLVQAESAAVAGGDGQLGHRTRHQLDRIGALLVELSELRAQEALHLGALPEKERLALAPLERELEGRQARLEARVAELRRAVGRPGEEGAS